LLFVLRGGSTTFFGSIIGAVLMVLALLLLSGLTLALAWLPYVGLVFLLMMTTAPRAIARLLMANLRLAAFGKLRRLLPAYGVLAAAAAVFLTGAAAAIEIALPPAARCRAGLQSVVPRRGARGAECLQLGGCAGTAGGRRGRAGLAALRLWP
jgi:O-antigen ligase